MTEVVVTQLLTDAASAGAVCIVQCTCNRKKGARCQGSSDYYVNHLASINKSVIMECCCGPRARTNIKGYELQCILFLLPVLISKRYCGLKVQYEICREVGCLSRDHTARDTYWSRDHGPSSHISHIEL